MDRIRPQQPPGMRWAGKSTSLGHKPPVFCNRTEKLDIVLIWLPKQCSELNAMDQLWRDMKSNISANHQYSNIDEHAEYAESWIMFLTRTEALRKASILSDGFWLKSFFK